MRAWIRVCAAGGWMALVCTLNTLGRSVAAFGPSRRPATTTEASSFRHNVRGVVWSSASSHDNRHAYAQPGLIALTREEGKNDKIQQALATAFLADTDAPSAYRTVELSCIAHADGPDLAVLAEHLSEEWSYIIVTSPEAAKVLAGAWEGVRCPRPPVAAVGQATEQVLQHYGIDVCFTPSKATAKVLAVELPAATEGGGGRVLYPASAKAKATLGQGLTARGFDVVRLDTYDTVTARWTATQQDTAVKCRVACFASPSSVHGWLQNSDSNVDVLAACIGETSAQACREQGWPEERIFYPDQPGIAGWVEAVQEATKSLPQSQSQHLNS
jgi:uroporphyrinogen-III synthase